MSASIPTRKKTEAKVNMILREIEQRGSIRVDEVTALIGARRPRAYAYLRRMHADGLIHGVPDCPPFARRGAPGKQWVIGADPAIEDTSVVTPRRSNATVSQVGMWRDGLVAALFGAAGGEGCHGAI